MAFNRKQGIITREKEGFRYKLRWKIEKTFSILEEILGSNNAWYVPNRDYDVAIGMKTVAYNLVVLINQLVTGRRRLWI